MLFNSLEFALFLPVVFVLYWFVTNQRLRVQNALLLLASYVFYGWWDWRFLSLIVLSSVCDYLIGLHLNREGSNRKLLLTLSLVLNLGILGFFKYYNFFVDSFVGAFAGLGYEMDPRTLNIILPVGISFYTFQTLSYTIDIYRGKLEPTRDALAFFAFVSFFPQLVAGPIERAKSLLPQFFVERKFDKAKAIDGLRQMLWGFFKKVVVADNLAKSVDVVFNNHETVSGSILVLGAVFFAFQIYCDFSGYSDIAIGTARLFGFDLMTNFRLPYFSRDVGEFWRRWHISLSTWFRDYVYIPLGGSRVSKGRQVLNSIITFTVSGFWHGANWTFVVWGFLNGLYYLPSIVFGWAKKKGVVAEGKIFPTVLELIQMVFTYSMITLTWIFFRAESVGQAIDYIGRLFGPTLFHISVGELLGRFLPINLLIAFTFIPLLLMIEWFQREKEHGLEISHLPRHVRWGIYILIANLIVIFGNFAQNQFIYFQF